MKRGFAALSGAALLCLVATQVYGVVAFRLIELDGRNIKWGGTALGEPAEVTVGFVDHAFDTPGARNCRAIAPLDPVVEQAGLSWADMRREVRAALDAWERVAGIRFELIDDAQNADILIGAQVRPRGRAYVNVDFDAVDLSGVGRLSRSLVCLNPQQPWKSGFDGRLDVYDLRYTVAHEIGHAIGLNHPGPEGQLMSYRYQEGFRTPQHGDIAGAVLLYGPPQQR